MVSSGLLAIVGGGFALAPCASAFDPQAKTNLAVYYVCLYHASLFVAFTDCPRGKGKTRPD